MTDKDIDRLRRQWQEADITPNPVPGNEPPGARLKHKIRESLRKRYQRLCLRMGIVCILAMLIAAEMFDYMPVFAIFLEVYFALMLGFQVWSYFKVRKIDLGKMSVCEAIRSVRSLQKLRSIKRIVGLSLAIPLLIYMLVYIGNLLGASYLTVCIGGAVIGGVLGWFINRHATCLLSSLREHLGDCGEDEGEDSDETED